MSDRSSTRWILWAKDDAVETAQVPVSTRIPLYTANPDAPAKPRRTAAQPEPARVVVTPTMSDLLDDIIVNRRVDVLFQPIVDVVNNQVVGFEALARGPKGPLEFPDRLFATARALGRAGELDWVARAAAFQTFIDANMDPTITLLINVERDSLISPCPEELLEVVWEAESRLRVCVDIAGRALARHPREVLETVRRARAARWGVALDDLEISRASLALLPVLEPDVIKVSQAMLDTSLASARTALFAAVAESERTGAVTIVEQVEDEAAKVAALTAGARYMQGYLFSKPGLLPPALPQPRQPLHLLAPAEEQPQTPFELALAGKLHVAKRVTTEGVDKVATLMSQAIADLPGAHFVAAVVADAPMSRQARMILTSLLERSPLSVVLGADVSLFDDWSVRTADLPQGHSLRSESCIIALSHSSATMLSARRTRNDEWEVILSQNPVLCRDTVRLLLAVMDRLDGGVRQS